MKMRDSGHLTIYLSIFVILQVFPVDVLGWSTTQPWSFTSEEECQRYYANYTVHEGGSWCQAMYDNLLCWPPSPYNSIALLPCPPNAGRQRSKTTTQRCTNEGKWEVVENPHHQSQRRLPPFFQHRGGPSQVSTHPCLKPNRPAPPQDHTSQAGGVITSMQVYSKIEMKYAKTTIVSTVKNTKTHPNQLRLKIALPKTAFISSLVLEIDGKNYTSTITGKAPARRAYDEAIAKEKDTILIKQSGLEEFTLRANVVSHQVVFYLTYEELLKRVNGQYLQNIHIRPGYRIPEAEVTVSISEREHIKDYRILELPGQELMGNPGAKISESLSNDNEITVNYKHTDPTNGSGKGVDGVFTIAFVLKTLMDGGEIQRAGNYFAHFLSLDASERLPKMPTHTVFALDVSNSMGDGKLNQMKTAMRNILKSMTIMDSFEILAFSSDVATLGTFNGTEVQKALRRVRKLQPIGFSNLNGAYLQSLRSAQAYKENPLSAKQIMIVTDGEATKGIMDPTVIRRSVRQANRLKYPIYGLAFGADAKIDLIRQISSDSQAFARHLDVKSNLANGMRDFYKEISSPILTNFDMTYPENEVDPASVVKMSNFNFYSGGEAVAVGKILNGIKTIHPWVTGFSKMGPLQLPTNRYDTVNFVGAGISDTENTVARLWAYLMVQNLLSQAEMMNDNITQAKKLLDQATQIAIKFGFVSHVTSLVVQDASGEYTYNFHKRDFLGKNFPWTSSGPSSLVSPSGPFDIQNDAPNLPQKQLYEPVTQGYVDLDPHFVVYAPGVKLPLCFDYHAEDGAFLSLIRDTQSGIIVNAETMSAASHSKLTYIRKLFLALGEVNITITPDYMEVDCLDDGGNLQVDSVTKSLWPFYKRNGKKFRKRILNQKVGSAPARPISKDGSLIQPAHVAQPSEQPIAPEKYPTPPVPYGQYGIHPNQQAQPLSTSQSVVLEKTTVPPVYPYQPTTLSSVAHNEPYSVTEEHKETTPEISIYDNTSPSHPTSQVQINNGNELNSFDYNELPKFPTPDALVSEDPSKNVHYVMNSIDEDYMAQKNFRRFIPLKTKSKVKRRISHNQRRGRRAFQDDQGLCNSNLTWERGVGKKYGDVMIILNKRKNLHITIGDGEAHFAVVRSHKDGQTFLGFYIENQTVMSRDAHGIIGQFTTKNITVIPKTPDSPDAADNSTVQLLVKRRNKRKRYRTSRVIGLLSKRRSLLGKQDVECIQVGRRGRKLMDGKPEDYLLDCLQC